MSKKEDFVFVDDWIMKDEDYSVYFDNKLIIIPFDKVFNRTFGENNTFCSFVINRTVFSNKIEKVCKYINYFIKFYDPENELIMNYVKLKFLIDDKKRKMKKNAFIKTIYEIFFTPTIAEKVDRMVEENYRVNLKKDDGNKYGEDMEFTNEHGKILFKVSVATNLLIPILNQYLHTRNSDEKILYDYFVHLFDIFSPEGVDMINKLSNYTMRKVIRNYEGNKGAWEQRDMLGDTSYLSYSDIVLQKIVVTDVLPKFIFNHNIVSLLTVVLENNLNFYNRGEYKYLPVVLNDRKDNEEGLSDLDKFEMSFNKIDESLTILSECNIDRVLKKIEYMNNIEISDEEIEFYSKHVKFASFQTGLVNYYYAKHFNGYRDLHMLKDEEYIRLLIILKRRLQAQGFIFLPQVLSGNIDGRLNTRTIQNRKFINKIQTSVLYNQLMDKFSYLIDLKGENIILNILSTVLNTAFSYVEYNNPEKLGERIDISSDIISEELLSFLNQI